MRFHKDGTLPDYPCIFVFGSNLAGRHGKGAAKVARLKYGAEYGVGTGITGESYAIPTKGMHMEVLDLNEIKPQVRIFLEYARFYHTKNFFVTAIGCGLAGYGYEDIAPLFQGAPFNCSFPEGWEECLNEED